MSGFASMPRGVPQIEITISMLMGFKCVGFEKSSGKENKITIKNDTGNLSSEDVENGC